MVFQQTTREPLVVLHLEISLWQIMFWISVKKDFPDSSLSNRSKTLVGLLLWGSILNQFILSRDFKSSTVRRLWFIFYKIIKIMFKKSESLTKHIFYKLKGAYATVLFLWEPTVLTKKWKVSQWKSHWLMIVRPGAATDIKSYCSALYWLMMT